MLRVSASGGIPASQIPAERRLVDMAALVTARGLTTAEAIKALQGPSTGGPPRRPATTPLERAQDLVFDAYEASGPRRLDLARQALATSADCADAYVLLAQETARTLAQARDLYAEGVAAGKRALGPRGFANQVGTFWTGPMETRPYMRALLGLANTLRAMGHLEDAADHYAEMISLNPNDNQGARFHLLSCLLEVGDLKAARVLIEAYHQEASAPWTYGRALLDFASGDEATAFDSLVTAVRLNTHVPDYLLGFKAMPGQIPEFVGFGDESEAVDCVHEQGNAWRATPGAMEWFRLALREVAQLL